MAAHSPPEQMEFTFPPDMRVTRTADNRVRITAAGPPRKWVRLRVAAERIGEGVDNRTALRLGRDEGRFAVRRIGGLWQVDLLGVENYLTDSTKSAESAYSAR